MQKWKTKECKTKPDNKMIMIVTICFAQDLTRISHSHPLTIIVDKHLFRK
ncbi:hypothetical protein NITUZ_40423 [Candidatus Nitrosotenuis uzonensis]|uniref:Uncharacterized protein n=1 Tax=Candidatus Nitrosotenuis uzonensis TaxID=1407055 RepID=V6AUQ8_9ARCH|nr:hypothetical protein NITUZ_40423 [Candidatus Nitrosotenuis uzonensis]